MGPDDQTPGGNDPGEERSGDGAVDPRIDAALDRVVYLLDRSAAPARKVRAFQRGRDVLAGAGQTEVARRAADGSLTGLDGIGPSIAAVVSGALEEAGTDYLDRLEASTVIETGAGAALRSRIRGDCHTHSTWSDGGAAIRSMAATARALGHDYLVVTDHSERLRVAHGLSPERLAQQRREIDALNEELAPFRLLAGTEVDIMDDGSLDLPDETLAELDVVIASVHHKISQEPEAMTRRLVTAVANPHVDILGHCSNRKLKPDGTVARQPSRFDADYVFAACARFDTAVEINCRPDRQDPAGDLLDLALEWGCTISIDSDAHSPGQLEWIDYGCDKATEHDVDDDRILNTRSVDDLLASLE